MSGSYIDIQATDGGTFKAYMAVPKKGSGPGLVLLQEIFGINPYMKSMADLFAKQGYVVLVPDLFWRLEPGIVLDYTEQGFAKAFKYYGQFDVDTGVKDITATLATLRARPEVTGKVGTLGYCLGGKLAYLSATRTDTDCSIAYYPVGVDAALDEASNITCPMVIHFAEQDKFVPAAAREQVIKAFKDRPEIEIYAYPGVDHAFATEGRDSYDEASTVMAFSRTLSRLQKTIGPAS